MWARHPTKVGAVKCDGGILGGFAPWIMLVVLTLSSTAVYAQNTPTWTILDVKTPDGKQLFSLTQGHHALVFDKEIGVLVASSPSPHVWVKAGSWRKGPPTERLLVSLRQSQEAVSLWRHFFAPSSSSTPVKDAWNRVSLLYDQSNMWMPLYPSHQSILPRDQPVGMKVSTAKGTWSITWGGTVQASQEKLLNDLSIAFERAQTEKK